MELNENKDKLKNKMNLSKIRKIIDFFFNQNKIRFFALATKEGEIIEKKSNEEFNSRFVGTIIVKILNIINWVIYKLDRSSPEVIDIKYNTGNLIIQPINDEFIILLIIEHSINKQKIIASLNSLKFQLSPILNHNITLKESDTINKHIDKLQAIIEKMEPPKLSEIKRLLTYLVE
ncbi:MAG: hypothetical protein ACTSPY_15185 [Candidatus Helarchaeota archaeon]